MDNIFNKLGKSFIKSIKELSGEGFSIKISSEEWKKTDKKPEIVDLWHNVQKSTRSDDMRRMSFNFDGAYYNGVEFWVPSNTLGYNKLIKKRLEEIGVKTTADDDSPQVGLSG